MRAALLLAVLLAGCAAPAPRLHGPWDGTAPCRECGRERRDYEAGRVKQADHEAFQASATGKCG